MEFMLQVVDEITDTLDHARFRVVDFAAEIGLTGCGILAALAAGAAVALGAEAMVLAGACGALGAAALLKTRHRLQPAEPVS